MGTAYYDPRSVGLRLDRTICMYKGKPVYVYATNATRGVTDDSYHMVEIMDVTSKPMTKAKMVDYRDADFDYRAMLLGYINYNKGAYYLSRVPSRIQKQGLCRTAITSDPHNIGGGGWFTSDGMRDMLLNDYPSYADCINAIDNDGWDAAAFHRCFAIKAARAKQLMYKGRTIGFQERNGKYRLVDSKEADALRMTIKELFPSTGEDSLCLTS